MGFLLNVDLETSLGPTQEAYLTIEGLRANRAIGEVRFTTTLWLNKQSADTFYKKYYEDKGNNAIGMLPSNVIYYKDNASDGEEVEIKNHYVIPLGEKQEVEIPVYKTKTTVKEVPYVSFDEEGNEITLYRTVENHEKVLDRNNKEEKIVIDESILGNLLEFCYKHLHKEIVKIFPEQTIEIIK